MDRMARFSHTGKFEPQGADTGGGASAPNGTATADAAAEAAAVASIGSSVAKGAMESNAAAGGGSGAGPRVQVKEEVPEVIDDPAEVFLPEAVPGMFVYSR